MPRYFTHFGFVDPEISLTPRRLSHVQLKIAPWQHIAIANAPSKLQRHWYSLSTPLQTPKAVLQICRQPESSKVGAQPRLPPRNTRDERSFRRHRASSRRHRLHPRSTRGCHQDLEYRWCLLAPRSSAKRCCRRACHKLEL
jgi:hypothetical protein